MDTWQDFLFLRHGQTDWNREGRFQGQTDIPLNAAGIEQAHAAADILARAQIDRIVTSPMIRALQTASIVAQRTSHPIEIDVMLTERSFGHFEGLVVADVKRDLGISPDEPIAGHLPPDAEQWTETVARTVAALEARQTRHPGERILFVAHHGLFAALSEVLVGARRAGRNAVPYDFRRNGARWDIAELAESAAGPSRLS